MLRKSLFAQFLARLLKTTAPLSLILLGASAHFSLWAALPLPALPPLPEADEQQLAVAQRVLLGPYLCEFNQKLSVTRSEEHAGYINVSYKNRTWLMMPRQSTSGAIRLEDVQGVALLLQIADKSMLMDTKSGQRMVDACRNLQNDKLAPPPLPALTP